jgi:hypothetical protein
MIGLFIRYNITTPVICIKYKYEDGNYNKISLFEHTNIKGMKKQLKYIKSYKNLQIINIIMPLTHNLYLAKGKLVTGH